MSAPARPELFARLLTLTERLSGEHELTRIALVVMDEAVDLLGAKLGAFWKVAPDGAVELVRGVGYPEGALEKLDRMLISTRAPLTDAIREGAAVWLRSREEFAALYPELEPRTRGLAGVSTIIAACLPLVASGHTLGALSFSFEGSDRLDEEDRQLLLALTRHCALAIERAMLFERTQRTAHRIARLQRVTAALAGAVTEDEVVEVLVREAIEALGARSGCVMIPTEDGKWLEVRSTFGYPEHFIKNSTRYSVDANLVTTEVYRTAKVVVMDDLDSYLARRTSTAESVRGLGDQSFLYIPLVVGERVLGVLGLSARQPRAFGHEESEFIEAVARQCALALDRAALLSREQRARAEAEAGSRAKDEFLAMLGHELRNPLSPILTALHLMRLRGGDALLKERTIIERQVQHLVRLVDDLLDVSRITRGKVELERRPVEIGAVVAKAIEMASPLLEARKHRLSVEVAPEGLLVDGDEHRLAQVLGNLLTNAAKYTDPGGDVSVSASCIDGEVVVRVKDSGMGISAELLPRVFELFVQGQRALDRSEGGLGLGLAIVRSLVEMHGGRVSASSEGHGKGSEMVVRLPAIARAQAELEPDRAHVEEVHTALCARRVLVVDDNRDAAETLAELLRAFGHAVQVALDGPSALAIAATLDPEVALLDIGLPVMDGYELAGRLSRERARRPYLVALTGYGQECDRLRARQAGFDEHLVKPVEFARVVEVIDRMNEREL
ncbi:hybrid sensor histidine kinase/response regulator [Polyangium aurulentum]|uniref:hybrid sensor histidine kinase/response regulator n=1 Tax=Polyangium aurulentum TaxID=2567896 RepID=UPI0010ADC482|nr:GAF domain-containing protein [Polyangium aurulentum]UQA58463.1 GAF domain-containing protein [Polyangium aurulentum]